MQPIRLRDTCIKVICVLLLLISCKPESTAQQRDCIFRDTVFNFNFGTVANPQEFSLPTLKNYKRDYSPCPNDGYYAFVPGTTNCYNGDWITLNDDHTPGNIAGKMMLVNASEKPGIFFTILMNGLKPATVYEFSSWMINICRINGSCPPLPPNILVTLETPEGKKVAEFKTGQVAQTVSPSWKRYFGFFSTMEDGGPLLLTLTNTTQGGCGNDFAIDDIVFRECYPYKNEEVKQVVQEPPATKKTATQAPVPVVKQNEPALVKKNVIKDSDTVKKELRPTVKPLKDPSKQLANLPAPLRTRKNELAEKITTGPGELLIELYDNGEIDGDTVSIYHNNELVVSHAAISAMPVKYRIKIDKNQPYHELVMVADNLGSIPPNTSLMIITGNNKRREVFISSTEQKNAKIIIQLNE